MQVVVRRLKLMCALVGVLSTSVMALSAVSAQAGLTTDRLGFKQSVVFSGFSEDGVKALRFDDGYRSDY